MTLGCCLLPPDLPGRCSQGWPLCGALSSSQTPRQSPFLLCSSASSLTGSYSVSWVQAGRVTLGLPQWVRVLDPRPPGPEGTSWALILHRHRKEGAVAGRQVNSWRTWPSALRLPFIPKEGNHPTLSLGTECRGEGTGEWRADECVTEYSGLNSAAKRIVSTVQARRRLTEPSAKMGSSASSLSTQQPLRTGGH